MSHSVSSFRPRGTLHLFHQDSILNFVHSSGAIRISHFQDLSIFSRTKTRSPLVNEKPISFPFIIRLFPVLQASLTSNSKAAETKNSTPAPKVKKINAVDSKTSKKVKSKHASQEPNESHQPKKVLVIVESPAKARTMQAILDSSTFIIESSIGHVRDLPKSSKDIPPKYKKFAWARMGIDVQDNFKPLYVTIEGKAKTVANLRALLKRADELILATDDDREGEAISWHLLSLLNPKVPTKRAVFHEITPNTIKKIFEGRLQANPQEGQTEGFRDLDYDLVEAQEARRLLDRLAGFTMSPLLWKKIKPGLSAGRVQSVAMNMLVKREQERLTYKSAIYYDISVQFRHDDDDIEPFHAYLISLVRDDSTLSIPARKDFDPDTGTLIDPKRYVQLDESSAEKLAEQLKQDSVSWVVREVIRKTVQRNAPQPFITSTLQQEAFRKLGLSPASTMQIAQQLYEKGFITYMRTDNVTLSDAGVRYARDAVMHLFKDERFLAKGSHKRKSSKPKNTQEAHEAIRPAGTFFKPPAETDLSDVALRLYDLIYRRTIASEMSSAQLDLTTLKIEASVKGNPISYFKAHGKTCTFQGYLAMYIEASDNAEGDEGNVLLPELKENQKLVPDAITPLRHETTPPPRFSDATLVRQLEIEGVGRPSTYASIVETLIERGYAQSKNKTLIPTIVAFVVNNLLDTYFPDFVDADFTAEMEEALDRIATGSVDRLEYLRKYFLGEDGLESQVTKTEDEIDKKEVQKLSLPTMEKSDTQIFVGAYGPYLVFNKDGNEMKVTLPNSVLPEDLVTLDVEKLVKTANDSALGIDPESGLPIYLKIGTFGKYIQLGKTDEKDNKTKTKTKEKPRRVSIPKEFADTEITWEIAVKLISLPRLVGLHPETAKEIRASYGRFGPYISYDDGFVSIPKSESPFEIGLETCLELIADKASRTSSTVLKDYGKVEGKLLKVVNGKYGPYARHGRTNIKLKLGSNPDSLEIDKALIAAGINVPSSRADNDGDLNASSNMVEKKGSKSSLPRKSTQDFSEQVVSEEKPYNTLKSKRVGKKVVDSGLDEKASRSSSKRKVPKSSKV